MMTGGSAQAMGGLATLTGMGGAPPGLISIEDFTTKVDPIDVSVKILKYEKKYIGSSVSAYWTLSVVNFDFFHFPGIRDRDNNRRGWLGCQRGEPQDLR